MKDVKDKQNILIVTIAGYAGSGKSTVMQVIVDALEAAGIEYTAGELPSYDGHHESRVRALAKHGTHVVVRTKQRRRSK